MNSEDNKRLIAAAMDALAIGDSKPFGALMHQDFVWTIAGSNSWSGEYRGLEAVRRDLFTPLFANFTTTYTNQARNILSDGDFVVVECTGNVMTKSGKPYNNVYCYVIRMAQGKMMSLMEYLDTQLVADVLEPRSFA
jgi:ketosteroid isomerase-like protein